MKRKSELIEGTEKEFLNVFNKLCHSRNAWQVWEDIVGMIACSQSNAADRTPRHFGAREKEYMQCAKRIGTVEAVSELLNIIVMAMENNPEQDFLGKMYMDLNLGNHWKGQFFTPYDVCRLMSDMTYVDADSQIGEKGYISICDPACGARATLIAAANSMKSSKYNFQNHVLFVGQDVDRVVAQMCYIQLSLLGCAGYICVGNTLTDPFTGPALFPQEREGQELWYMPMFQSDVWQWRRIFNSLGNMCGTVTTEKTVEKEHFLCFSILKKRRRCMGTMKTGILHFTDEPDIKHFAEVKVSKNDNVYGVTWANLVREYLKTAYLEEDKESEVISDGVTYKVLKRKDVTAFYDADGNTLFDVENKRLDREYGLVMDASKELGTECQIKKQIEETAVTPETMAGDKASGVGQAGDGGSGGREGKADAAKKKYESSLEACKPHEKRYFEGPIKEHMLKRFGEDGGFCEDFLQKHKTFQKCIKYLIEKARASVPQSEMQAIVEGSVYLEWMEDYFRKDDKAEEEEKDRKEAERKEKQKKAAAERAARAEEKPSKAVPVPEKKVDTPKEQSKPKKNNRDMDGQLDMFSMMGM